jgi:hypothetical protein
MGLLGPDSDPANQLQKKAGFIVKTGCRHSANTPFFII